MLSGVLLHLVKPPFPVDALIDGGAGPGGRGQGRDGVPDDPVLFVDIGDLQDRPVGQGQGAPVGRLTASLGVKDGAGHGNPAPATVQGLSGQNEGRRLGAVGVGLVKMFGWVHVEFPLFRLGLHPAGQTKTISARSACIWVK